MHRPVKSTAIGDKKLRQQAASDSFSPQHSQSGVWPLHPDAETRILGSLHLHEISAGDPPPTVALPFESSSAASIRDAISKVPNPLEFLSNLFALSPVGLCVLKVDGHVLFANQVVGDIFGLPPLPNYNIFSDTIFDGLGLSAAIRQAFAGQAVSLPTFWYDPRELRNIAVTEGRRVAISVWMFPVTGSNGKIENVAAIYRDDTAMMRIQEQLKTQSDQLEQHILSRTAELEETNEELEAFTYSVSHDLRAPLRAIDSFAALVAEDSESHLSSHSQDCIYRIRGATLRMTDLIADLLAFSRLGKQALQLKPTAPQNLVSEVLQELEPRLRNRNVSIEIGKLPNCQADATLLREVFLNLLENAIKFSGKCENATISVAARMVDQRLVWSVSDNGVGFNMADYSRLFGVFSRLHSIDEFEGTGVGLALVRRIIKRHGGDIWAQGEVGKGATFYFTLSE